MESAKTKKVVKKKVAKKKATPKPKVEMISYSIKMVIPTGDYANIQPEIVVKAGNPEEAHAYMAPHMNKLWKEYFQISKRTVKPEVKPNPVNPVPPQAPENKTAPEPVQTPAMEQSPVSSVALTKATQAIESCMSMDALNLIIQQIKASVKLTEDDKITLAGLVMFKEDELKENEK